MVKRSGCGGERGFTLIELMIVVAIVGLLAAIAIPNFIQMQLRSKRSELPTNLAAIRTVEGAYFQSFDTYTACATNPSSQPGTAQRDWEDNDDWKLLGYKPDGKVRGSYTVEEGGGAVPERAQGKADPNVSAEEGDGDSSPVVEYTATGLGDMDGDENYSVYTATQESAPVLTTDNNVY